MEHVTFLGSKRRESLLGTLPSPFKAVVLHPSQPPLPPTPSDLATLLHLPDVNLTDASSRGAACCCACRVLRIWWSM